MSVYEIISRTNTISIKLNGAPSNICRVKGRLKCIRHASRNKIEAHECRGISYNTTNKLDLSP
jgi:hypothetical protein